MKLKEYYEAKKLKEFENKNLTIKITNRGEGQKYATRQAHKRGTTKRVSNSESQPRKRSKKNARSREN